MFVLAWDLIQVLLTLTMDITWDLLVQTGLLNQDLFIGDVFIFTWFSPTLELIEDWSVLTPDMMLDLPVLSSDLTWGLLVLIWNFYQDLLFLTFL